MQRPLCLVLEDVAAELAALGETAETLQAQLGASMGPDRGPIEEDLLVALQSLDHFTQSAQCLARFAAGVAAEVGPAHWVDIAAPLAAVWLSKLGRRLAGGLEEADAEPEMELFDPG